MKFLKPKDTYVQDMTGTVNEMVFKQGDVWNVKTVIEVPKSLISRFVAKAKQEGIDPKENWGDAELAELFVKYITTTYMNAESLPVSTILGEEAKEVSTEVQPEDVINSSQPAQAQVQNQVQNPTQAQAQAQTQPVAPAQAQEGQPTGEIQM